MHWRAHDDLDGMNRDERLIMVVMLCLVAIITAIGILI
jgi:hypothetical protein